MMLQEYVNRVKCEEYDSFNSSAFKLVYQEAISSTRAIISANEYYKEQLDSEMEKFCNENHIATIISFLGDRGVGKSSAMLSFAHFLSRYSKLHINDAEMFFLSKKVEFCVFPKIDVTMLTHEEGLFDVVLAKMWDMFLEEMNSSVKKESIQEQVRRKFEDVKKSYNRWNTARKESGVSQLAELHGLSQSLNLRADFSKLVDSFSEYKGKEKGKEKERESYLVFAIDDLDMVIESAYMRLEELRLFLTIPNVIVLVTADIDQLILSIQNTWEMKLDVLVDDKSYRGHTVGFKADRQVDYESAHDYAVKYLAKVLPRNMRIFMPDSNQTADKSLQSVYVDVAQKIFADKAVKVFFTRQRLVDVFLRKETGMILYNKLAEIEQKYSLRDTVDTLAELEYVISNISDTLVRNWMKKEIYTTTKRLKEKTHGELVTKIIDANVNLFERHFSRFCMELKDEFLPNSEKVGYRGTIEKLRHLNNEKIEWAEFIKILIWIYGLKINERLESNRKLLEKEMQNDFFLDALLEENFLALNAPEVYVTNCFDSIAEQDCSQEEMYEKLDRLFHTLLFYDMEAVLNNMEIKEISKERIAYLTGEEKEYQKVIWNERKSVKGTASFYWFFQNALWYDQRRDAFVEWLIRIWKEEYFGTLEYEQKSQSSQKVAENILAWRKNFLDCRENQEKELSIFDIVPVQSIGMMMEICQKVFIQKSDGERIKGMSDCLEILTEIIQSVYEEMEEYYQVTSRNEACYEINYARVFGDFVTALDIKEVSRTYFMANADFDFDFDTDMDNDSTGEIDFLGG